MKITQKEMQKRERECEKSFKNWLDKNDIPYWYIQQDIDTFSPALKRYMTRRPDFMILIPNIGFILTDVEYKKSIEEYGKFPIDKKETEQYVNLQKYFNIQIWYVFSHKIYDYNSWYWIPAQKVLEEGEIYKSRIDGNEFLAIPTTETILLSGKDNIGTLLSKATFLLKSDLK